ncbi:MAG: cysteine hydrolase [Chloroflexi bacterium]|nr:cysteine hydrolase [Chloroflexota bacterium]
MERWQYPSFESHIDPSHVALVVVDMQNISVNPAYGSTKLLVQRAPEVAVPYLNRLKQTIIPNIRMLLAFFREHGLPVVYLTIGSEREDGKDLTPRFQRRILQMLAIAGVRTVAVRGTIEHQIIDELLPRPGELVINKTSYSAFNSTSIDQTLRNMGVTGLIFAGVGTSVCVEGTARDASDRGYSCILVEDACTSFDQPAHEATMRLFARAYGDVRTTKQVISDLARGLGA